MHKGFIWGAVAALGLSAPAFAEEGFSYSYLDLGYVTTSIDDTDIETDGFGLFGSLELTDQFHLIAGFSTEDLDLGIDAKNYQIGAGLTELLTPTNGALMAILLAAGVPFGRWMRFAIVGVLIVAVVGVGGMFLMW